MEIIKDIIDLAIYDEHGRGITVLDCLQECNLQYRNFGGETYIAVEDILLNLDLLKQIGNPVIEKYTSDFEKRIYNNIRSKEIIKFNNKKENIKLKLVGSGVIHSTKTHTISHDFDIVIPNAELLIGRGYEFSNQQPMVSEYIFKILPYNVNEDLFDLVLKERV